MIKEAPEFSVVITSHNKGEFLANTIGSVLRQTFKDFEIIVIDHGSTDDTKDIVGSFADSRIRYVYKEDCGLPACPRNRGMELSNGKYIALLDGDDYWREDKLEICKKVLDENRDVDLVCHNLDIVHNGHIVGRTSFGPYVERMYEKLLFEGSCLNPSAVVIRRRVFFEDGFRFSEDRSDFVIEDYEYWIRLSRRYRFFFLTDALGYYTLTSTGAFLANIEPHTVNTLRLLDSHFANLKSKDERLRRRMKRRRSSVMAAAGRLYLHKKDFEKSRIWYIRALKEWPLNYKAALGLTAALLKFSVIYR